MALALTLSANAQATGPRDAEALTHFCDADTKSAIRIDGRQEDWESEAGPTFRVEQMIAGEYRLDWTGPNDASFLLWCRQSNDALYFAIAGRDNAIQAPRDDGKGDRMELWFELPNPELPANLRMVMIEIPIWPVLQDGRSSATFKYGRQGAVPGADAVIGARHNGKGFFVEAKIPLAALGGAIGFEPIRFSAVQRDWDHDGGVEREAAVGSSVVAPGNPQTLGNMRFGRFANRLKALLGERGMSEDTVPAVQTWANIAGDARREWIGVLGKDLIVTGEGLPTWPTASVRVNDNETHEPLEIRAINIDTDPELEIVYRYRITRSDNRNNFYYQDFIAILDTTSQGIQVVMQQEVANELRGGGKLTSEIEYRDRGTYTIIRIRRATGNLSRGQASDVDAGAVRDYHKMIMPWEGASKIDIYNYGGGWQRIVD